MCGFIGILKAGGDTFAELVDGLVAIQHRGQDAAGVCTFDDRFHLKRGAGLVRDVFDAEDAELLRGRFGIGHVRYPTIGAGGAENAQPFLLNHPYGIALAHNGNLTNYHDLAAELRTNDRRLLNSSCDAEVILNVLASEIERRDGGAFSIELLFESIRATMVG